MGLFKNFDVGIQYILSVFCVRDITSFLASFVFNPILHQRELQLLSMDACALLLPLLILTERFHLPLSFTYQENNYLTTVKSG